MPDRPKWSVVPFVWTERAIKKSNDDLRAAIRNFHLGPCKIEKSKIAKLCRNKGIPKTFIKI